MTIPDEAVDAAYNAYWMNGRSVEKMIEAAAPFIAAQAWDEGWDAMADFDHRQAGPYPTNPYRSGT